MKTWTARMLARAIRMALDSPLGPWLRSQVLAAVPVVRQAMASSAQQLPDGTAVPEITPLEPRRASIGEGRRLNLLIPAVSERHVFGGIATALRLFERLQPGFAQVRIVVLDEVSLSPSAQAWYGSWPQASLDDASPPSRHLVPAGDRYQRTLAVAPGDVFVATAWWTAHAAHRLLRWQAREYGSEASAEFIYLIQDYEPGFYPWSTRYALARRTYEQGDSIRAVINTGILARFLHDQGHRFARTAILEPRLNPALARHRLEHPMVDKECVLFVYGRPSVERNAFGLILMALRQWVATDPGQAAQWQVVTAGESFADVDLGHGVVLRNLGKLSLQEYAHWLGRSAVGVSIMISPHPSYPPLEMAAFGATVLTNAHANKDLSSVCDRLISVPGPEPEGLAQAIGQACSAFMQQPTDDRRLDLRHLTMNAPFLQDGDEVSGLDGLLEGWT